MVISQRSDDGYAKASDDLRSAVHRQAGGGPAVHEGVRAHSLQEAAMTINLKMPDIRELKPRITVFGVGGAGGNAVNNMITAGLVGCDFVVANTDAQALTMSKAERIIQMGVQVTEGLGAGSQPEVGRAAAEEVMDEIRDHLSGAHMVFVTAGMGGGTGTGASPVVARVAREMGKAMMGAGEASGEKRALTAAEAAISNPLIDDSSMKGARGLLISITGGRDLTLYEVDEAATRIREEVDQEANIIVGATFDEALDGIIRVSVVATGIDQAIGNAASSIDSRLAELTQKLRSNTTRLADRTEREPARAAEE